MQPTAQKPQKKKSLAQQTFEQPVEIVKTAVDQISGAQKHEAPPETPTNGSGQAPVQQSNQPPKPSPEQQRVDSRMQAFREELKEVYELRKKREEEMRARREESEEVKKQRKEEAKKAQDTLIEPITKKARGMLGGAGRMFGLGKKQRSIELGKTPQN